MMYPPSLPLVIRQRAFRASNGELGIIVEDVEAFLTTCEVDAVAILGWEVWLVDHGTDRDGVPVPHAGIWTGHIPVPYLNTGAVIHGSTSGRDSGETRADYVSRTADETRLQLGDFQPERDVTADYLRFVRVNFTLERD